MAADSIPEIVFRKNQKLVSGGKAWGLARGLLKLAGAGPEGEAAVDDSLETPVHTPLPKNAVPGKEVERNHHPEALLQKNALAEVEEHNRAVPAVLLAEAAHYHVAGSL